jgi:transcriptional regulator with XRE-family HTH domain
MRELNHLPEHESNFHMTKIRLMRYSYRMAGVKSELGPTGRALAEVVRKRREDLGLTYAQLSRRLTKNGRDIPTLGLRRIESCQRHVDVDDLVALAVALEVAPVTLLMPGEVSAGQEVALTGYHNPVVAERLWNWLSASYPIYGAVMSFYGAALPYWERTEMEERLGAVRRGS